MFVVVAVAVVARLALSGLPLVLTNDSIGYIAWGREFAEGRPTSIPPLRTPGYPLFLAGVFSVFGVGSLGVHLLQSVLGVVTAGAATWAVCSRGSRRWAVATGLFFALWPTIMCWESYLLSESIAILVVVVSTGLALGRRGGPWHGLALGTSLGIGCLIRPSVLVLAAALAIGWWIRAEHVSRRKRLAGAMLAIGMAVTTGPWLWFNGQRGIYSLAGAGPIAFWYGMESAGALDDSFALPEAMDKARGRLRSGARSEEATFRFLEETGAWHDRAVERVLGEWSSASLRSRPWAYARGVSDVLLRHLGIQPNDLSWFVARLGVDGQVTGQKAWNMQVSDSDAAREFWREGGPTKAGRFMLWTSKRGVGRFPQVVLLAGLGVAGWMVLARRDWGGVVIVAGAAAFFVFHAVMLLPSARLVMPAVAAWGVVVPMAWSGIRRAGRPDAGHMVTRT